MEKPKSISEPKSRLEEALAYVAEQVSSGGGGGGDFELVHTTQVYEVNDIISDEDKSQLIMLSSHLAEYCAFMYFTSSSGDEYKCPVYGINVPKLSNILANNGPTSGTPRLYCSWAVGWSTNTISRFQAYVPTSNQMQTPVSSYIKIYKYNS